MAKLNKKSKREVEIRFDPGRVLLMTVVVSVLTLVFIGALVTL